MCRAVGPAMIAGRLSIVNGLVFDGTGTEPEERPIHTAEGQIVGLEGPPPADTPVIEVLRSATSVNAAIIRRLISERSARARLRTSWSWTATRSSEQRCCGRRNAC